MPPMPMTDTRKAFLQIHFCVVLWGFTAILGKMISLPALPLVWWRLLIVVAALALVPRVWRGLRAMPPRLILAYAGIGALVSLHWLTFYGAIKLSNASVGATCIALGTVFVALLGLVVPVAAFAGARQLEQVTLLQATGAACASVVLGIGAILLARRARRNIERSIGRVSGASTARVGRLLGFLALCVGLIAALALGAIVLFGRIYVGAHLPLDVIGGAALGAIAGSVVNLVVRPRALPPTG